MIPALLRFGIHSATAVAAFRLGAAALVSGFGAPRGSAAEPDFRQFNEPPHAYFARTPTDRFARVRADLEAGRIPFERGSERAFLTNLLAYLEIPVSSQMLVFSTTSLQLSRITPSNPRALYFSEDLYLGYIPGGRLELVALDRDLGAVFYIFDLPRESDVFRIERATRCMNCHAGEDTGHVPGLVVKSVAPGLGGGSLDTFRSGQTGHAVPFAERFGGWYVTGDGGLTNHWGNSFGRYVDEVLVRVPNSPAGRASPDRYPLPTSDLLPQLVHEHQVGFVNRVVEAAYRARTWRHADGDRLTPEHERDLDEQAAIVVRYLLFRDEAPLPSGGVAGDPAFRADFLRNRRAVDGISLRDFELRTRLFRHRCSYMIYSPVFAGLPSELKGSVYRRLGAALDGSDPDYRYLGAAEREAIRRILRGTLTDLPTGW